MVMDGTIQDVGVGGVFFHTRLLVEIGERAIIEVGSETPVPARVVWLRGLSHPLGLGLGLAFELKDARAERAALELVLAVFDGSEA